MSKILYHGWSLNTLEPNVLGAKVAFKSYSNGLYLSMRSTWLIGSHIPNDKSYVITADDVSIVNANIVISAWLIVWPNSSIKSPDALGLLRQHLHTRATRLKYHVDDILHRFENQNESGVLLAPSADQTPGPR